MLLGDMPGRGVPGRGAPGRACGGRGAGRSTGCAEENGLLPTRGVRGAGLGAGPGRGPGVAPGAGAGRAGAAGAGGADAAAAGGAAGAAGGAGGGVGAGAGGGVGAAGRGPGLTDEPADAAAGLATLAGPPLPAAFCGADLAPNDSRKRRATGASTVDDADLTNSPWSFSFARSSLLVTPSSFANSCTRALPATTSPSLEAMAVVGAAPRVSYDTWSSGLHGVLIFLATCSVDRASECPEIPSTYSVTAVRSGEPVIRSARTNARRRIAACRHCGSGCSHAPRPGRLPAVSTVAAHAPFPPTATTRSSSTASSRFRHPTQVRTGPTGRSAARPCRDTEVSRWITAESTATDPLRRNRGPGVGFSPALRRPVPLRAAHRVRTAPVRPGRSVRRRCGCRYASR
jgi:hypothetical protein